MFTIHRSPAPPPDSLANVLSAGQTSVPPNTASESSLRPFVRHLWGIPFCFRTVAATMAAIHKRDAFNTLVLQDPLLLAHLLCLAHHRDRAREFSSIEDSLGSLSDEQIACFLRKAATVYTRKFFPHGFLSAFRLYSTKVAVLCAYMARAMAAASRKDEAGLQLLHDQAYVAGALHAVGELFMLANQPAKLGGDLLSRERFYSLNRHDILLSNPEIGVSYEQAGSTILRRLGAPAPIADLIAQHALPFEESDHDPLTALLALAVWKIRTAELGYDRRKLVTSFPDTPAIAAGVDFDALHQSPSVNRIVGATSPADAIAVLLVSGDSPYPPAAQIFRPSLRTMRFPGTIRHTS